MVASEKDQFLVGLLTLAAVFRAAVSEVVQEAYWQALVEFELRVVGIAMRRALKESRFMPPPAELVAFARHAQAVEEPTHAEVRSQRLLEAAEKSRVRASWTNAEQRTNGQMLESCYLNLQAAKKQLEQLRELDRDLPLGDVGRNACPGTPSLVRRIGLAQAEVEHWQGYVTYWRGCCAADGDDQVAGTKPKPAPPRPRAPSPLDDPKLDGDPIVEAERANRTQQQELEQLARTAAAEGRVDQVEEESPF